MIPRLQRRVPGGFMVSVEVPGAYVDVNGGLSSRFDDVFVAEADWRGKSLEEKQQALLDAMADADEITAVAGQAVPGAPTQTKAIWETRAVARYSAWQMWKATRIEAQARSLPAGVITALTNRENQAWTAYMAVLDQWRTSPV